MGPVIPGPQMKMAEQKENAKESEPFMSRVTGDGFGLATALETDCEAGPSAV
jgi:hypothetical protein